MIALGMHGLSWKDLECLLMWTLIVTKSWPAVLHVLISTLLLVCSCWGYLQSLSPSVTFHYPPNFFFTTITVARNRDMPDEFIYASCFRVGKMVGDISCNCPPIYARSRPFLPQLVCSPHFLSPSCLFHFIYIPLPLVLFYSWIIYI